MDAKDNKIESNNLINLSGNLMDLSTPKIMGVVNVNNDSFYRASRASVLDDVLKKVEQHLNEGADIIDLGAISTRPDANLQNSDEEMSRLIPAITAVKENFPGTILSIDTFRSDIAEISIKAGGNMINDVYGGRFDGKMFEIIAKYDIPYILMHSRGFAKNMNDKTGYSNIAQDIIKELSTSIIQLRRLGVKDVIIDPGFGFAKTIAENYELLNSLEEMNVLNCPVLVGFSRKSMIYKKLGIKSEEALNGTTVLNTVAYTKGANIFRVHDVKQAKEIIQLLD